MCLAACMIGSMGAMALGSSVSPIILTNIGYSSLSFLYSFPICVTYILLAFPVF